MTERIEAAREKFDHPAYHDTDCTWWEVDDSLPRCSCGLNANLTEFEAAVRAEYAPLVAAAREVLVAIDSPWLDAETEAAEEAAIEALRAALEQVDGKGEQA